MGTYSKGAAGRRLLQHQRDDEVGVVEVPAELVARVVEHDVQRADLVGLAKERLDAQGRADEAVSSSDS